MAHFGGVVVLSFLFCLFVSVLFVPDKIFGFFHADYFGHLRARQFRSEHLYLNKY